MMVVKVVLAQNPKDAGALLFLSAAGSPIFAGRSSPELGNFGGVGIGFELVGSVFEDLVELAWPDAHFILLYNASHNCLHLLLLFYEFHHKMKNIGTDVSTELLLSLASCPFLRAL